jgi:hypothetical protein
MFTWFRHRAIDRELTEILDDHARVRADATMVRDFLLRVLEENRSGVEKFSDDALSEAGLTINACLALFLIPIIQDDKFTCQ